MNLRFAHVKHDVLGGIIISSEDLEWMTYIFLPDAILKIITMHKLLLKTPNNKRQMEYADNCDSENVQNSRSSR